jgi:arylsulfatase A-like enzyme
MVLNCSIRQRKRKASLYCSSLLIFAALFPISPAASQQQSGRLSGAIVEKYYSDSTEAAKPAIPQAKGSPNIIWIMLDDVGFGASSAFGGVIDTPTFDMLANNGLRYSNFHTTGVCAPTRAAILTGRNHHSVGMGLFPEKGMSAEFPGYSGRLDPKDGTIADYLRAAGYSTYALGKWHLTPEEERSDFGPFDHWPTSKGFDHYFGFLAGADDQYKTDLVEDLHRVKPDGRHLNIQLIDKAISYIDHEKSLDKDRPFFMYIAPGATHSPVQVDQQWINKYKGRFEAGWDVVRQEIFDRQKRMGLIPTAGTLPERDPQVPAWVSLNADQKAVYERQMEAYAGFLDETDHEIGRLINHLNVTGILANTVIFVVIGDNGASKEGRQDGMMANEMVNPGQTETVAGMKAQIDKIGTSQSFSNYPIGWAQAMDTPFRKWKGDADVEGAIRNPLIAYWQGHFPVGLRTQYSHVIDLLPTTLEIAHVAPAPVVDHTAQSPIQGISLAYSFNDAAAPTRHGEQYYFLFGNGSIYKDGWSASFFFHPDFFEMQDMAKGAKIGNPIGFTWALYNMNTDFNEQSDLSKSNPKKLAEMKAEFDVQAKRYGAFPLITFKDIYSRYDKNRAGMSKTYREPDGAK